jgi:hypothetical protein
MEMGGQLHAPVAKRKNPCPYQGSNFVTEHKIRTLIKSTTFMFKFFLRFGEYLTTYNKWFLYAVKYL